MEITQDNVTNKSEKLSLIVKSSSRKEIMEISDDTTISNFKELIATKFSVDAQSLRLIYAGRILKDADTIKSLNIKNGYTVYVVVKPSAQSNSRLNNEVAPTYPNLQRTLSRDLLQYYVNTPDILRSMLNNNPALQQVIQRNPEIGHIINNPRLLQEAMEVMQNPNVANEFVRSADRAMSNIESLPGGFNALQQMYHDIEEPLMDATDDSLNPFINLFTSTTITDQQGSENRAPLPNPWSQIEPIQDEMGDDILVSNSFVQNMLEQLQNRTPQLGNADSPQIPQDFQGLLSNMANSGEFSNLQQQVGDLITQILSQNGSEHSGNDNVSPEAINAVVLPALLLAGMARNQQPDSTNNNITNSNLTSNLLSQLNLPALPNSVNFEEQYRAQMQQLTEMGFVNPEANLQALVASFGDLSRAIEMLLSRNLMS